MSIPVALLPLLGLSRHLWRSNINVTHIELAVKTASVLVVVRDDSADDVRPETTEAWLYDEVWFNSRGHQNDHPYHSDRSQ